MTTNCLDVYCSNSDNDAEFTTRIILLLMDMQFELHYEFLQFNFGSHLSVANVLSRIPFRALDDILRAQAYSGVCSYSCEVQHAGVLLSDFCSGSDNALVAIPLGVPVNQVVDKAMAILSAPPTVKQVGRCEQK